MTSQVTSDNLEITQSMRTLTNEKLSKLEKHLGDVSYDLKNVRVVLNKGPEEKFTAKVELTVGGYKFFSEAIEFALETALINAVEEIDRQFLKEKSRNSSDRWKLNREMKRFQPEEAEEVTD